MNLKKVKENLKDYIDISDIDSLIEMADLLKEMEENVLDVYNSNPDLRTLEEIKKHLSAHLIYMAQLFGKVKKYKGSNHTYLEDARKQLKAKCIEEMSGSVSKKREEVYNTPQFKETIKYILKLKEQFIIIEELYENFQRLYNSIQQSISIEVRTFQGANSI